MKYSIEAKILGLFLSVVALVALSQPAHAEDCSTATVAGNWGATLTGTLLLPTGAVPVAGVIRLTIDKAGNVAGTQARSVGGNYADETISGTLTVNSDCTASLTATIFESGQAVRTVADSVVFDDHARQARMVQKSLTLPDGTQVPVVITAEAKKQ